MPAAVQHVMSRTHAGDVTGGPACGQVGTGKPLNLFPEMHSARISGIDESLQKTTVCVA